MSATPGLLDVFVIDRRTRRWRRRSGLWVSRSLVTDTVMTDAGSRASLAREMLGSATMAGSGRPGAAVKLDDDHARIEASDAVTMTA
jgi:hypothetical protein